MGLGESATIGTGCVLGLGWLCGLAEKVGSAYTAYTEQTRADSVQACQDPENADAINCRIIDGGLELAETLPMLAIDSAPMLAGVIGGANEIADMAAQKALNNRATSGAGQATREALNAQNVANGVRLREQLAYEEAQSLFTKSGTLRPEVIAKSIPIVPGNSLENTSVTKALTSGGKLDK